jgi:hypothetical protein
MGLWNAHTSVGNIAGSLMAAGALRWGWGWSFVVPGGVMIAMAAVLHALLVVEPQDVGFAPQSGTPMLGSAATSVAPSRAGSVAGGSPLAGASPAATPSRLGRGASGGNGGNGNGSALSAGERATLERRVSALAEARGGTLPARLAALAEAHHGVRPPRGAHGLLALGSTLVKMEPRRDSFRLGGELSEGDEEAADGGEGAALLGGGGGRGAGAPARRASVSFAAAWCIPGVAVYAFTLFFAKLVSGKISIYYYMIIRIIHYNSY